MKILALNSGSSSIKYRLFESDKKYELLEKGSAERIGQINSTITRALGNKPPVQKQMALPDYKAAMHALFPKDSLNLDAIGAAGHRVVHGGETFKSPTLITKEVIKEIKELAKFAPLHCQPNVTGIEILQELLPHIPHVAIFDTAAHAGMDSKAFLYALPMEYYEKYKIRKYGFHGINHSHVAHEAARILDKRLEDLKIITCHLGNGCSISAFQKGKSIDNSMGLTPLEGLVMGTRSGDLDPSVVTYLIEELRLTSEQVTDLLNKKSGLLGLCGKSDMRDILLALKSGDKSAKIAVEVFVYRVQKYIGAYIAALNGVDAIVFTGGIGENSPEIRALVVKNFSHLNLFCDESRNENKQTIFSKDNSTISLLNIQANEEIEIAKQTHQLITGKKQSSF